MDYPTDFNELLRRKPICGVLSIAMIAGVAFARATQIIKNNMLSFQKRHGGKTYHEQRCNALKELGINFREIKLRNPITLSIVVDLFCFEPDVSYMVTTSEHIVTVLNGIVADQVEIKPVAEHKARRCIVRHILEIAR